MKAKTEPLTRQAKRQTVAEYFPKESCCVERMFTNTKRQN